MTILGPRVDESRYPVLRQSSSGKLFGTPGEGCKAKHGHFTAHFDEEEDDDAILYDDARLYENSSEEEEGKIEHDEADVYDGYDEDERTAYDETES